MIFPVACRIPPVALAGGQGKHVTDAVQSIRRAPAKGGHFGLPIGKSRPTIYRAIAMDAQHSMDILTDYCRKCGASAKDIVERNSFCIDAENVTGVSHLIARRQFKELMNDSLDKLGF